MIFPKFSTGSNFNSIDHFGKEVKARKVIQQTRSNDTTQKVTYKTATATASSRRDDDVDDDDFASATGTARDEELLGAVLALALALVLRDTLAGVRLSTMEEVLKGNRSSDKSNISPDESDFLWQPAHYELSCKSTMRTPKGRSVNSIVSGARGEHVMGHYPLRNSTDAACGKTRESDGFTGVCRAVTPTPCYSRTKAGCEATWLGYFHC